MFQKILFATSATEICDHAARVAFNLARQANAQLTVLHVLGVPSRGFGGQTVVDVKTGEEVQADDEYKAWVLEELKVHYAKQLADAENTQLELAVGAPHREILRKIREAKPDLVVMGNSASGDDPAIRQNIMAGATLHRVAKASASPVMVVARPAASFWGGVSSIVFVTDFTKASDTAFRYTCQLAREINGEIHIFHPVDISTPTIGSLEDQDSIEKKIRETRKQIHGRHVAQMEGVADYSVEVWEGIPYVEIVKFAREKQADLIVMAHQTKSGDQDDVQLGRNIEQVLVRSSCPVISVNKAMK
jgi:nucleotide-binding universal stress UspA family protein